MKIRRIGVAVFVKTPGLTPLKTRLANTIGRPAAEDFYRISCKCILSTLRKWIEFSEFEVSPYWAVSEADDVAADYWKSLPNIPQGDGDLGAKLDSVYGWLMEHFDAAVLLGADAPQVTWQILESGLPTSEDFVLGKAKDGGFYFFSGTKPLSKVQWQSIPYSQAQTFSRIDGLLKGEGRVRYLGELSDIDFEEDFDSLAHELDLVQSLTSEQKELVKWLKLR